MGKHTKLFYKVIAGIRATGNKNGYVYISRIKTRLHTGFVRAVRLWDELVEAGVLRKWNKNDFKKLPNGEKGKGNILWKNLSKYH